METVRENYQRVVHRIRVACDRACRSPETVRLVGVTKYVNSQTAGFLAQVGCLDLAESRPQSLWQKASDLAGLGIRWHMIGHLQRNKVERTLRVAQTLHSLDSERLLDAILTQAENLSMPISLLLEINVSEDHTKTGMSPSQGRSLLNQWFSSSRHHPNVRIVGLMGMSSLNGNADQAKIEFGQLRDLRDAWELEFGTQFPELSMGMSDDFEIAIEQGATMVRIGSTLFETEG